MRLHAPRIPTLVVAIVSLLAVACNDAPALTNDGYPVTDVGPFEVGYRRLMTTYDPMDGTGPRTIRVAIWYPTVDNIVDVTTEGHAYTLILRETNAFLDAPLRPSVYRDGYPVVVHSHGDWGHADQNFHVAEGLARHGYVVVSPNHEQNSSLDIATMTNRLSTNYYRPMDVSAALDLIESGLPAGDPLAGKCVTDRVVLSGHSRGTQTVLALLGLQWDRSMRETECANGNYAAGGGCPAAQLARFDANYRDPRVIAAVLAGGDGGPSAFVGGAAAMNTLTTPLFFLTGTDDGAYSGVTSLVPTLTGPESSLAVFTGGCHDLPAGGGCTNITDAEAWPVINDYYRAFVRRHLFDDQTATVIGILDGTIALSPKVTYTP